MKGSEWCEKLQTTNADIQSEVLSAVARGDVLPFEWQPVPVKAGDNRGVLFVGREPLRVGEANDYVYAMVSSKTAQHIADALNVLQPTTAMLDAAYLEGVVGVAPPTQPADAATRVEKGFSRSMMDAMAMLRFSRDVQTSARGLPGLVAMPFKVWVITNKLATARTSQAYNYGFYDSRAPHRSASGITMWQPIGSKHDCDHFDYSQAMVAVHPMMLVNGEWMQVVDVGSEPNLCSLVSSEGVVKTWRQPCVPDRALPERDVYTIELDDERDVYTIESDRELKLEAPYMTGHDVVQWQIFLRLIPDGVFGPRTAAATREFQLTCELNDSGVVDSHTIAAARGVVVARSASTVNVKALVTDFRQAKSYTKAARTVETVQYIVLHTAEIAEAPQSAEALMNWAAGPNAPAASWHFAVDNDTITQSVREEDVAWHAPGANHNGIGIEMCGRAKQTPAEWEDAYSSQMLDRCARLVAALCSQWSIPVVFVDEHGLKQGGTRGITTHAAVTKAFRKSTHMDPGASFPMQKFLSRVAAIRSTS